MRGKVYDDVVEVARVGVAAWRAIGANKEMDLVSVREMEAECIE
jgi:hypothetical protein